MENWTIIYAFAKIYEADLAQSKLESEGIAVQLKDESIVQSLDLYSDAVGGIKLLVPEQDRKKAVKILTDAGFIVPVTKKQNSIWGKIELFFAKIPILSQTPVEFRLALLGAIVISLIIIGYLVCNVSNT